jgi:hypothetical protein
MAFDNKVRAKIINGLGAASGTGEGFSTASATITLQRPHLKTYFPKIEDCYNGTINVLLDYPVEIRLPEIVTPPLPWGVNGATERFGITEVRFELDGDQRQYPAWVYTAECSPHLLKTGVLELLAEKIDGIQAGRKCFIGFRRLQQAKLLVV